MFVFYPCRRIMDSKPSALLTCKSRISSSLNCYHQRTQYKTSFLGCRKRWTMCNSSFLAKTILLSRPDSCHKNSWRLYLRSSRTTTTFYRDFLRHSKGSRTSECRKSHIIQQRKSIDTSISIVARQRREVLCYPMTRYRYLDVENSMYIREMNPVTKLSIPPVQSDGTVPTL